MKTSPFPTHRAAAATAPFTALHQTLSTSQGGLPPERRTVPLLQFEVSETNTPSRFPDTLATKLGRVRLLVLTLMAILATDAFSQTSGRLRLICPADQTAWSCGGSSSSVTYPAPTTLGGCSDATEVRCTPRSGSLFRVGNTKVNCFGTDECGSRDSCSFVVTVRQDNQAPRIHCPRNMVVYAASGQGAVVEFRAPAHDDSLRSVTVKCDPPSGSRFPMGVTPVDCEATDPCGFTGVCSFEVDVRIPKLNIQPGGNGMLVSWLGEAGLEEADSIKGPWRPVSRATSPYLVAPSASKAQKFFRPLNLTAAPFEPTHRVQGRIRFNYVQRGPDILNSVNNPDYPQYASVATSIGIRDIRRATVVLQDQQGHYIKGKLNEQGEYSFAWNPVVGDSAQITVTTVSHHGDRNAAVGRWNGPAITHTDELTSHSGDYRTFSYIRSFALADARISNGGLDLNITIPETHESAKAFWLLENALLALDYFLSIDGVDAMPKLNIVYTPELPLEGGETAFYNASKNPGFIFIPHGWGWMHFPVRHEAAHCFHRHYLRDLDYGKMGEALANAHAMAMSGGSWMDKNASFEDIDAQPNFIDGEFRQQDGGGNYWSFCDGCNTLDYSYGWTQRALWDLLDGPQNTEPEPLTTFYPFQSNQMFDAGEFDLIDGGASTSTTGSAHLLNDVLMNYLGGGIYGQESANYQDRGLVGVDLVDVLDGFICRGHATAERIDRLINHAMMFGYPLDAPADCD